MANSTSANLKLTVQATGENSGTWGQITNTNLLILEQAIGGFTTFNITNAARSLTFTNGALSNGKNECGNPAKVGPVKLNGGIASPSILIWPFLDFPFNIRIPSLGCFILQNVTILSKTLLSSKTLRSNFLFLKNITSLELLGK